MPSGQKKVPLRKMASVEQPRIEPPMSAPVARSLRALFQELGKGTKGLWPLLILVIFTIIGALIFMELESPNEVYTLEQLKKDRVQLIDDTVLRLNNIRRMQPTAAYNHTVKQLLRYTEKIGVEPVDVETQQKWTFWGSMFYACTVYTTIGYGSIYPATTGGRIFTILYSFIGIPLTLICLYYLGLVFARICKFFWKLALRTCGCFSKDLQKKVSDAVGMEEAEAKKEEDETNELLSFPISFLAFLAVLWILLCAAIWAYTENWDYGTSLYFTLISFTTIGFGDIVPNERGFILFAFLLFIGLALVSTVLNLIQQQIEALATGMQDNIDREYMTALAEAADEGEISEADMRRISNAQEGKIDPNMTQSTVDESNKRALDAVIARMPLKERLLFRVMPAASRKQLEASAQQKANRKNRGVQTDQSLLENLIKEEILKLELNNELDRRRPKPSGLESPFLPKKNPFDDPIPPQYMLPSTSQSPPEEEEAPEAPIRPHRGFKIEKVTEVGHDEDKPVISTTVLKEDDV